MTRGSVYELDDSELIAHLHRQKQFLIRSCESYDAGFEDEACRIAVAIRVLVHDTQNSLSLFQALKIKGTMDFWNSARPIDPANLVASTPLIHMQISNNGNGLTNATYVPNVRGGPSTFQGDWQGFQQWWPRQSVIKDKNKKEFTRKDLILMLSNKDGGAHVDKNLDEAFAAILKLNSVGWEQFSNGKSRPFDNQPAFASVRQIGYEMIKTLENYLTLNAQTDPSN